MVPRSVLVAIAALLILLVPTASADAALDLTHVSVDARELSAAGDGVIGPGDRIVIDHTLRSATPISGMRARLSTTTPNITLVDDVADYANVATAGGTATTTSSFEVALPATGLQCGAFLAFTVTVEAGDESAVVAFVIPTGSSGPWAAFAGASEPIHQGGHVTDVHLDVPIHNGGMVKDLRVELPHLTHPRLGDLRADLIAPDGAVATLFDGVGGDATTMGPTTFADGAAELAGASAPHNGTFRPQDAFARFEGRRLQGRWTLRLTDKAGPRAALVEGFAINARRAYCAGIPRARLAVDPAQLTPGGTVNFDASASSDSDGRIVSYEFDLDGDGVYEIAPTTDPTWSRTYPTRQSPVVKLRVTDNNGLVDVDEVRLPVTAFPVAGVIVDDATPLSLSDVTFDAGASSDADGEVVRYEWDLDGRNGYETDTRGVDHVTTSYATPGTRRVGLRITDDDGARAETTVDVVVGNRAPDATLTGPAAVVVGHPMAFSAAGSVDPDGTISEYEWDLDGNGHYELGTDGEATVEHVFSTSGPARVGVRVTDDRGVTDTATLDVVVRFAPVVTLTTSANPVSLRRVSTLDARGTTDPDGSVEALVFAWDLDGDEAFDDATGAGPHDVSFATAGVRRVGVRVTDADGASIVKRVDLDVRNALPQPRLAATPGAVDPGESVTLSASGSTDPDGTVAAYEWDLDGDGSFERTTGSVDHTTASFPNPGYAQPSVRAVDNDGGRATTSVNVLVRQPPEPVSQTTTDGKQAAGGTDAPPGSPAADARALPEPATGGPGAASPKATPPSSTLSGASIQKLRRVLRDGLTLTCQAPIAGRCVLEAEIAAADARRLGLRVKRGAAAVKLGRASAVLLADQPARLRLKMSPAARKRLEAARSVRLVVRGFTRSWTGRRVELTRVVLLRR